MGTDIGGLHHVGVVVHDLTEAIGTYRRLGFTLAAPGVPALPGEPPTPVGAANTHIHLRGSFVELVSVNAPAGARQLVLTVPEERLPVMMAAVRGAVARVAAMLDRFEGLHILVLDSPALDDVVARFDATGVEHGGAHAIQRPVESDDGTRMVPVRFLEIGGSTPEGRLGVAQNLVAGPERPAHANGAVDLVGCTLGVPGDLLPEVVTRYESYLDRTAVRDGSTATFDLGAATLTLVAGGSPDGPAFLGFTVAVEDIVRTGQHLRAAGVPHRARENGELVVPPTEAGGTTITFRPDPSGRSAPTDGA